jgi:hypothetical protein
LTSGSVVVACSGTLASGRIVNREGGSAGAGAAGAAGAVIARLALAALLLGAGALEGRTAWYTT